MNASGITILCKVVDNYGDIGFVYRLARAISELAPDLELRLIVSNLAAFASMNSAVDSSKPLQLLPSPVSGGKSWQVFHWDAAEICRAAFREKPPALILECFQCGRPQWLDDLLFGSQEQPPLADADHIFHILNIDYLTAEDYADDFHCLKSGTRSRFVKKVNFMPGFTAKTGGLPLDTAFMDSLSRRSLPASIAALPGLESAVSGKSTGGGKSGDNGKSASKGRDTDSPEVFYLSVFSYEQDFTPIVRALARFQACRQKTNPAFHVHALVASGKSQQPFFAAWQAQGRPFAATALPFLSQQDWDALLTAASCNLVRGEDSLARACLSGRPFLWHAYPQEDDYQLVKVEALLKRLQGCLPPALYADLCQVWTAYNKSGAFTEELAFSFFWHCSELEGGFSTFSSQLIENGNFAGHLLSYLHCSLGFDYNYAELAK